MKRIAPCLAAPCLAAPCLAAPCLAAPCLALVLLSGAALAESPDSFDWPQWRGPDRNAVSKEGGLLQEWPKDGPALAWRVEDLGGGYSAPAIAAGCIYGMSNRGDDEVVWALSEKDGKELWATPLGPACEEGGRQGKEGPDCTPTVDGDRIYVLGAGGNIACLQANDGKIIWKRSIVDDFGGRLPRWRYSESPLIDGDKLICTPGGEDATMVALDKSTGKTIWKTKVPDPPRDDAEDRGERPGRSPRGPGNRPQGNRPPGRGRGGFPSMMEMDSVLKTLDADGSKEISAEEIDGAPAALAKLDKNEDGKITEEEVVPEAFRRGRPGGDRGNRRGGGPPGGIMRFMPTNAALDADRNGEIDAAEMKNSAAALKKLDENKDGKLTEDEVRPRFGRPGGSRGGSDRGRRGFGGPASSAAYSSPIAIDVAGVRQYVQFLAKSVVGVAASDGKVLWQYAAPANRMSINCSTPIYQDGLVFAASAYGNGGGAVRLTKEDGGTFKAEEVYFTQRMQNHHGGMIVVDGCLYGANGGNEGGYLACLDFQEGDVLWRDRKGPKGSLALADGRLYLRSEDGEMLLIEPSRERLVEHGRFDQPDRTDSPAWTHPVIANGKLYIRDQGLLLCYDVKRR